MDRSSVRKKNIYKKIQKSLTHLKKIINRAKNLKKRRNKNPYIKKFRRKRISPTPRTEGQGIFTSSQMRAAHLLSDIPSGAKCITLLVLLLLGFFYSVCLKVNHHFFSHQCENHISVMLTEPRRGRGRIDERNLLIWLFKIG